MLAAEELTVQTDEAVKPDRAVRRAQEAWAALPVRDRVRVLGRARGLLAERTRELCGAISPELARSEADTLVAEVLPLLEAARYLEREAERVLRPRVLGRRGLPWWLGGLASEVERVPLGHVLVVGPANYPLFLPGVQTLQALAAGNSVVWKPGRGGHAVAALVQRALEEAGLPERVLTVTGETVEAGRDAVRGLVTGARADKVIFTGSPETWRVIQRELADAAIPCVAELSGCDSVVVLASADMDRVVQAVAFGMRLNGSATCMAPRRLFLVGLSAAVQQELVGRLREVFAGMAPMPVAEWTAARVRGLLREARSEGAEIGAGVVREDGMFSPVLVESARASMEIARTEMFAPVLSVVTVKDAEELLEADEVCPFGLTASIFGDESEARRVGGRLRVGTVMINDLIVPTADPRVPFMGRRGSGFGATRGAEGLLEMTTPRTVIARRDKGTRQYEGTTAGHVPFFEGMIGVSHGRGWSRRWRGMRDLIAAARKLR